MTKYFKYLHYILKHKYYVFIECCKLGIPWLGIIHDCSKFRPSEFFPYADHFFGPGSDGMNTGRDKTGYYSTRNMKDEKFKFALFLHLKRNKHHWQWWILSTSDGEHSREIPNKYFKEMLGDWKGASKSIKNPTPAVVWYTKNRKNLKFNKETRKKLDDMFLKKGNKK